MEESIHPASSLQRQFWLAQQADNGGGANNMAAGFLLRGPFEPAAFIKCFRLLIRRHPVLCATYDLRHGTLWQAGKSDPAVEITQLSLSTPDAQAAKAILAKEAARPFNLETGPVIRVVVISAGVSDWYSVAIIVHHIAIDFSSFEILGRELSAAYNQTVRGVPWLEPSQTVPYSAFAAHESAWLASPQAVHALQAWRKALAGCAFSVATPTDFQRPPIQSFRGGVVDFSLGEDLSRELDCFCRAHTTDPFVALLATYFALFRCYSASDKFAVGVPFTNRRASEFVGTFGCFVNILPIVIDQGDQPSFLGLLQKTRRALLEAHRIQELPIEQIVAAVERTRQADRNPLYQMGFTVEPPMVFNLTGIECESFHVPTCGAQLDLFLRYWKDRDGFIGQLRYSTALFRHQTATNIAEDFCILLRSAVAAPNQPIGQLGFHPKARCRRPTDIVSIPPASPTDTSSRLGDRRRIAIAATFTAEPMLETFEFWFERLGWQADVAFAPFNQIFQQFLNPSSLLRQNARGTNLVFLRFDDLVELSDTHHPRPPADRLRANLAELATTIQAHASALRAPLCLVLCPSSPRLSSVVPEEAAMRADLVAKLHATPGLNVLEPDTISHWCPVADWYEPAGEELGHIPYTPQYLAALATSAVRFINALTQQPIKAIVTDCDGTLWDGVVGEDGPEGVRIGHAQKAFQEFLLQQHRAGVLLCLCSKNHEADAWAVFDRHPGMVLKREHIAFARINWLPKSVNVQSLAAGINIGLNALAFLDDNPLECAEVRAACPAVLCPELPAAWEARTPFLKNLWPLDRLRATAEDQKRNEHYRSEHLRAELRKEAHSYSDFLSSLQLIVETARASKDDVDRLAQLTVRTNQFNTTVRRLGSAEVASYLHQNGKAVFATRVRDRFGDYGLVGAAFSEKKGDILHVDPLLLSCRALGRGVEYHMAAQLASQATATGCTWVDFPVTPTDRNEPARSFLQVVERDCGGSRDPDRTLRVAASKLEVLSFVPSEFTVQTEAERTVVSTNVTASGGTWDSRIIQVALDFRTFEDVLSAYADWRQNRSRRSSASTPPRTKTGAPLSKTEQTITMAWKTILALPEIGTGENFFEIGGSSILAAQLALELRRQGLTITLVDLFHYPTIAALACSLDGQPSPNSAAPVSSFPNPAASGGPRLPAQFERLRRFRGK